MSHVSAYDSRVRVGIVLRRKVHPEGSFCELIAVVEALDGVTIEMKELRCYFLS